MAYIDKDDFIAEYGVQAYTRMFAFKAQPTDPEPDEGDASTKFERVANAVAAEVDGYLRRRYTLPLATVPADLVDRVLRMVYYYGLLKSAAASVTEPVREDYRSIVRWLEAVAAQKVDLGLEPEPATNSTRSAEMVADERIMTASRLKGVL